MRWWSPNLGLSYLQLHKRERKKCSSVEYLHKYELLCDLIKVFTLCAKEIIYLLSSNQRRSLGSGVVFPSFTVVVVTLLGSVHSSLHRIFEHFHDFRTLLNKISESVGLTVLNTFLIKPMDMQISRRHFRNIVKKMAPRPICLW